MLDLTVYPDVDDPPTELVTDFDKADYVARICGAWDFGITPTRDTFMLFASWRGVFDRFPLPLSPAYAALRSIYGWPPVLGGHILRADFEKFEAARGEENRPDPCAPYW